VSLPHAIAPDPAAPAAGARAAAANAIAATAGNTERHRTRSLVVAVILLTPLR